jgi:CrcB protein
MIVLTVGAAASAGAVCRYLVDLAVGRRASVFPWGTLVVNVTGSLALGFVVGLGIYQSIGDTFRTAVGAGFLGAYTTFSTFSYETVRLLEEGVPRAALLNAAVSLTLGLAAVGIGLALAATL